MNKFKHKIILLGAFFCLASISSVLFAQCPAIPPTITSILSTGAGSASVTFSIDCTRDLTACESGDATSVIWHVAFLGQGAPAPNGTNVEYGSGTYYGPTCNFVNPRDGGMSAGVCMAPKNSTCRDSELGQLFGVNVGTFSADDICAGGGSRTYSISGLCEGQTYDVYLYEMEVNTIPNDDPSGGTGITGFTSIEEAVGCGATTIASEAVSAVSVFTDSGTLTPISDPIVRVGGIAVCTTGNGDYSSMHQSIPDANSSNNPAGSGAECLGTNDVNTDMSAGVMTPNSIPNDISFTDGTTFGSNVVLVNCRDNPTISFPTPTGCKGTNALTAGTLCDPTITDYTNAAVYMWVEDINSLNPTTGDFDVPDFNANFSETTLLLGPNTSETYPDCYIGSGEGLNTCPAVTGTTYPNNYTGRFGNYITSDNCGTNFSGNNPLDGSVNPFSLPGTVNITDANGVVRASTTVCVQYEDDCNGTKSRTCVRFVSDITPLVLSTVDAVDVSCAGSTDGSVTITGLAGGTPDPNQDGDLSDGTGTYTFAGGLTFVQTGAGTWEATGVAPGTYNVTIADPAAAACGSACDLTFTAVVRPKLPSTITGTVVVCPDQCVTIDALLTENPIVNYDVVSSMNPANVGGSCPGGTGEVSLFPITPFFNASSTFAPSGGICSSQIGNSATDASIVEFCFEINAPDLSNIYISLDNGSGYENLWLGTAFTGGIDTGTGNLSFCTSAPVGSTYDGTLDGSTGGTYNGDSPNGFYIYLQEATGTCGSATFVSASLTITDRCVESQTAAICTDTGMDALTWVFNSGPGADLLTLNGPTNESGEFCALAATPAGDYIYDVSGSHIATGSNPAICCPASGQLTVTVLDVPTPPTPSITNGTEYCSTDAADPLTFAPALSSTPGEAVANIINAGLYSGDWLSSLTTESVPSSGSFDILVNGDSPLGVGICTSTNFSNAGVGGAATSNLAVGNYQYCIWPNYDDGLDDLDFEILDHCGNLLIDENSYVQGDCNPFCATFTVDPNQLTVTGPGISQTSDPDGIANNGDEVYEFDPATANVAAGDGSSCGENLINYQITTTCGCVVDETIALFVYEEPVATDPAPKTTADCDGSGMLTFSLADLMNGADGAVGGGDDLTGSGNYTMTYDPGTGVVGPVALGAITIDATTATSPIVVTITNDDSTYGGMIVDPQDATAMLACDGNGCNTTMSLAFEFCCPTIATPTIAANGPYCIGDTGVALSTSADNGGTLTWYDADPALVGTVALTGTPTPSTAAAGTTNYWVTETDVNTCVSSPAMIAVVVNALPTTPTIAANGPYCIGDTGVALSTSVDNGGTLTWYDTDPTLVGTVALGAAPTPSTAAAGATEYWVTETDVNTCVSLPAMITVTVSALPTTPTIAANGPYCIGDTGVALSTSVDNGGTLTWYDADPALVGTVALGAAPTPSTAAAGTTNYWVTETDVNTCVSSPAMITVTVNALPTTPTGLTITNSVCQADGSISGGSLNGTGTACATGTLTYYSTAAGTAMIAAPTFDQTAAQTFYVRCVDSSLAPPCESDVVSVGPSVPGICVCEISDMTLTQDIVCDGSGMYTVQISWTGGPDASVSLAANNGGIMSGDNPATNADGTATFTFDINGAAASGYTITATDTQGVCNFGPFTGTTAPTVFDTIVVEEGDCDTAPTIVLPAGFTCAYTYLSTMGTGMSCSGVLNTVGLGEATYCLPFEGGNNVGAVTFTVTDDCGRAQALPPVNYACFVCDTNNGTLSNGN